MPRSYKRTRRQLKPVGSFYYIRLDPHRTALTEGGFPSLGPHQSSNVAVFEREQQSSLDTLTTRVESLFVFFRRDLQDDQCRHGLSSCVPLQFWAIEVRFPSST